MGEHKTGKNMQKTDHRETNPPSRGFSDSKKKHPR